MPRCDGQIAEGIGLGRYVSGSRFSIRHVSLVQGKLGQTNYRAYVQDTFKLVNNAAWFFRYLSGLGLCGRSAVLCGCRGIAHGWIFDCQYDQAQRGTRYST